MTRLRHVLHVTVAAFASPDAHPQSPHAISNPTTPEIARVLQTEREAHRDSLLHRLGATRDRFADRGFDLQGGYIGEFIGNLAGGLDTGVVAEGIAALTLDLDLEKLFGWEGGALRAGGIFPHGESPSAKLVGDLQGVSNIDTFRDEPVPYEVWLQQSLLEDQLSFRAGLLVADSEFAATDAGGAFLNSSFGWPVGISINTLNTGPAFFRSALGLRARYESPSGVYIQAGVFDGDTFDGDPLEDDALGFELGGDDGLFAIAESGRRWTVTHASAELPGKAGVGAWFHSGDFLVDEARLDSRDRKAGVYVLAEQTVWHRSVPGGGGAPDSEARTQSITLFARTAWSPADRSVADASGDVGIAVSGLLPGRFNDTLALGFAWLHTSPDLRSALVSAGLPTIRTAETVLELTWSVALTAHWTVRPDYQWVRFVGDPSDLDDAHVLGCRLEFTF